MAGNIYVYIEKEREFSYILLAGNWKEKNFKNRALHYKHVSSHTHARTGWHTNKKNDSWPGAKMQMFLLKNSTIPPPSFLKL